VFSTILETLIKVLIWYERHLCKTVES